MRLARVLGAVGRALISAGVIVLLFVAYQLWGTGLQHSAAQSDLGNEFEEQTGIEIIGDDTQSLEEAAAASQEAIEAGQIIASDPDTVLTAATDDADDDADADSDDASDSAPPPADLVESNLDEEERAIIQAKLYPEPGEAFARVVIPAINVDQISVEGVSVEDLRKGPGHYRTTPNPGQAGNAAIAGHRTTYGAPFNRVDELVPGDPIFVTTVQGTFRYEVMGFDDPAGGPELGHFIVSPSDTWVLDQQEGQNILTLTACHPKFSARQRIIVQAELIGEPVPTIPRDEALEESDINGNIDSGAADERAGEADAVDGDSVDEIPEEEQVIIGDDVAADDDPSVDAEGNPIEDPGADADSDSADDADAAAGVAGTDEGADSDEGIEATAAAISDEVDVEVGADNSELAAAQTPFNTGTDDFGEGLNGDPEKVRPAIMWGIAGVFIWICAWFMGRELERKWTLYAIALLPFVVALWSTFVNLDQALPSY